MVKPSNPAMRFVHPRTGQSVVIDLLKREVIHVEAPISILIDYAYSAYEAIKRRNIGF